jgi:hypothetical protein
MSLVPTVLSLLQVLVPTPQNTARVTAADPPGIVAALQGLGYKAKLETDDEGDPIIRSAAAGLNFSIEFYGCEDNRDCRHLMFSAAFDMDEPLSADLMNDWNMRKLVGVAWVDEEGDPGIDFFVTTEGGLDLRTFEEAVDLWGRALGNFGDHIDW